MVSKTHTTLVEGAVTLPRNTRTVRIIDGAAWFSQGTEDVVLKTGDEVEVDMRKPAVISLLAKYGPVTYHIAA